MQQRSKPLTNASISLKWLETERPCLLWCHALNIIKYHSLSYYVSTNAMLVLVPVLVPWELTNVEARHLNRPSVMSVSQIVSVCLFKPVSCHKATSYYAGPLCLSPGRLMALDKGIRPTSLTTSETVFNRWIISNLNCALNCGLHSISEESNHWWPKLETEKKGNETQMFVTHKHTKN